jgi:phage/plasmid primase-like uncharacterized protein
MDWRNTLVAAGIDPRALDGRHHPCPGCGGRDRFRFDDRDGRGTWICGQGGDPVAGDGWALLSHVFGWDFVTAHKRLGIALTAPPTAPPRRPPEPPKPSATQPYALSLWAAVNRSDAAVAGHPYARAKRIDWHAGAGVARASGCIIGRDAYCLVVPIRDIETRTVAAVQCINADGQKQTFGPVRGNAFIAGNVLYKGADWFVVEGWADAASVFRTFHRSVVFAAMGKSGFDALAARVAEIYSPPRLVLLEDAE